jgi:hypothetical protein
MSEDTLLQWLQDRALAQAIRSGDWLFPAIETVHVLSLATVFGSILQVDLRLLGLSSRASALSQITRETLTYTWAAFGVAALSGSLMFISKAPVYFHNLQLRLKLLCLLLAGLNMLVFHVGVYRRVSQWDRRLPPPAAARMAGALSIALWLSIIALGRWIGFTM